MTIILEPNLLFIHLNPQSSKKQIFLPKTPISVNIPADRKNGQHYFHHIPYNYTIKLTHGSFVWTVVRNYKDIRDAHRVLAKEVKKDLGRSCSDLKGFVIRINLLFYY